MGHKHTREQILDGALGAALDEGLSQLSFGRLAKRLGISDRVVVYYFPTKDDLIGDVLATLGVQLRTALAAAFTEPAADHRALARMAWPTLARPEVDPVFALFFEAVGLAGAGREPYRTLAPQLMEAWAQWLVSFFDGPPDRRRAEADATIALLDGLLLVRQTAGPATAERAAVQLGVA